MRPLGTDRARPVMPAVDYVARAKALAPLIAASIGEIEQQRRLPDRLVDAMLEAGLFRLLLPRAYDGAEIDPVTYLRVIETIAREDASTAWCLCQTAVCAMSAAYLPSEAAREIFGDRRAVLAWGAAGPQRAIAVEGGYKVSASWGFASGGHHATWLGGHCLVCDADGTPRLAASGAPVARTLLFPAEKVTWTDMWQVMGLRGTGSDAYAVTDLFVPDAHSLMRDSAEERRYDAPLYHLRTDHLYACGFASVALGIARALLDAFLALALEKTPRGYKYPLRDNAVTQTDVAEAEATLRAARFYLQGTLGEAWQRVQRGDELPLEQRAAIRLAATYAIRQAKQVADMAYYAAGATAIFASNGFERRFRDLHAVTQQLQGRRSHFEMVGKYLLGLEADLAFL